MIGYTETFNIVDFNNNCHEIFKCKTSIKNKAIHTKDLSVDIRAGYKIFKRIGSYEKWYLITHVAKKRNTPRVLIIYIMDIY